MTKRAGRASPLSLVLVGAILLGIGTFLFTQGEEGADGAAVLFMSSLAKGDVEGLVKTTYIDGASPEVVKSKWERTLKYTRYHRFQWSLKTIESINKTEATARIGMLTAADTEDVYHRLPMVKRDGKWLVDVAATHRSFFPSLPR